MRLKLIFLIIFATFVFTGCNQERSVSSQDINPKNTEANVQTTPLNEVIENKFFIGKWKSEEIEINTIKVIIFLNIERKNNESGFNITYNFDTTTSYYPSLYIEERSDSLYFYHNSAEHRAEYVLTLGNNDLIECKFSVKNCFGMEGTFEKDIKFTRLSKEDEEKYCQFQYIIEPKSSSKINILREYAEYGKDKYDVKFEYKYDERENMLDIIGENNLDELVEGKSDAETAIALMNWLCERYKHGNPPGGLASNRTPQALMEFADENDGTTNCRGLALILAQLIRAYNIKAFHITCMPYEEPFVDCHAVVSVYCDSLSKWIMLDPTYNLYLKNESDEIIGVDELRDILIAGEKVFTNDEAGYNNQKMNLDQYREYMAKNLIRLKRGTVERYGSDENDGAIILIPEKYMQNEAKNFDEGYRKYFMTSEEDFWKATNVTNEDDSFNSSGVEEKTGTDTDKTNILSSVSIPYIGNEKDISTSCTIDILDSWMLFMTNPYSWSSNDHSFCDFSVFNKEFTSFEPWITGIF